MTPTRAGHTFLGWYKSDGNKITSTSSLYANTIVYAQWSVNKYDIVGKASPVGGGTVSGGGSYDYSKTATLTATPATGYKFKQWNDGNTNNPRTVTATSAVTYTAIFAVDKILIGTSKPTKIYFNTLEVKEVYFGTTKVFG
jgi:uncharacterized repeat protein (TIGR02543 family)